MADFLLELRCEEIPARMQAGARVDLEKLFRAELAAAGVEAGEVTVWSTPRRLALIARDLPDATEAVREELKGPRANAPEQALEGFLRKTGLTKDQLEERDGVLFAVIEKPGGAVKDVLAAAIPAIAAKFPWPKSMRWGADSISTGSTRWVRPLSGIVAILGEDLVPFEIGGVPSGYATLGHRFHHPGAITIGGAHDYAEKLHACHVIVDHEERAALIRAGATAAAADAGLTLVEDEGLVAENAGLTEWPVPLLGRFDAAFLEVPPEVIQLTARVNQKYFVCTNPTRNGGVDAAQPQTGGSPLHHQPAAGGPPPRTGEVKLANAFVCTANIEARDGGEAIVDGNRKVLAARLSDARFFWEQDRKTPLAEHARKLERITFHEKLGTVADKVERVAKLARWLVETDIVTPTPRHSRESGNPVASDGAKRADWAPASAGVTKEELADLAEQAARLCKADLVTEMVGEFPELQGLMGGYYARAEGVGGEHTDLVADAIRDHYKPVGQGDEVPTAPVTVAVSLADKLDTIAWFFFEEMPPTGSKDPFALRRAALGVISILQANEIRLPLNFAITFALWSMSFEGFDVDATNARIAKINAFDPSRESEWGKKAFWEEIQSMKAMAEENAEKSQRFVAARCEIIDFFADRLKVQQREAGVRHDLIDAVFALGGEDDLVRLLARVRALQAFVGTEDGANLLAGYKRAANILKKENHPVTPAQAGVQTAAPELDSGLRRNDEGGKISLSYTPENAEKSLIDSLSAAEPTAEAAVAAEDFEAAMAALASLRAPIDTFFDEVTVNDADPDKRAARLDLLARFRAAVHKVADFSRIEG